MFRALLFLFFAVSVNANRNHCLKYSVHPSQYELTITPYIFKDSSYYYCDITIHIIANFPDINVIELDAKDLIIQQGSIRVFDGRRDIVNGARPYEYDDDRGKLFIYLREPLRKYKEKNNENVYKIMISFTKYVTEDTPGVFLVKYYDTKSQNFKYMYTTQFSSDKPNKAKYAFPCFDNPRFEAGFHFKVHLVPQRPDLQYTNTSLVISDVMKTDINNDNYQIINYMPSPQVALHQVGFHFSQFTSNQLKASQTNDTLVVWSPSDELKYYNFILKYGVTIINLIHEFSKTNRPLMKFPINLIAVPKQLDGYEISSWNLLTNSAFKIAYIEDMTSIKQIEQMKFELAQQLSRLWLGNPGEVKVTQWSEEWFKEGLATYLAYYLMAQYNNGIVTLDIKRPLGSYGLQMKQRAMASDWLHSTPALMHFQNDLAVEIPPRYRQLVTMKAGAIWWMLENWFQTDQLHASLVKHIYAMRGQYISVWDLIKAIDKDVTKDCTYQFINGTTPTRILNSWINKAGYPVVHVIVFRGRNPNAIQLKQNHFSYTARNREPTDFLIPISYHLQNSENCFNCHIPRFTIAQTYTFRDNLNNGWIILNRNAAGYYRVNYDRQTWQLIAKSLKQDPSTIDEMNRAQIVNDVFALYMAGDIDRILAEEILEYLYKERSPVVWDAVRDGFNMLRIDGANTDMTKNLFWEWEEFIRMKMDQIFNIVVNNNDRTPQIRLFRSNIINFANEVKHEPCLEYLRNAHEEYRLGKQRLDPDIRQAVFYLFENQTHSGYLNNKWNPTELEDKIIAEHRVRENNKFFMRLAYGEPRPPQMMSTEKPIPEGPVNEKLEQASSAVIHLSSFIYLAAALTLLV